MPMWRTSPVGQWEWIIKCISCEWINNVTQTCAGSQSLHANIRCGLDTYLHRQYLMITNLCGIVIAYVPRWYGVLQWDVWQCRCCQMLCGLGKVQETIACPNIFLRIRGEVFRACLRLAMLYGSEPWGPKEPERRRLGRNDRAMIRWICGIKDRDETPWVSLLEKLGIDDITLVFTVGDSSGMATYSGPRHVSNLSQTLHFPAIEGKHGLGRLCED